ncbi:MAG: histidine phosphatase family protein [Planctomycetota bacterium]|jgi:broad specificity phosphatase PhoE
MKSIWIIRHAESLGQLDETVCGVNPDLSLHGELQAKNLTCRISQIKTDIVLLSPLTRAWRTYQLSEYQAPEVTFDNRLTESNWGRPDYYDNLCLDNLPDFAEKDLVNDHCLPTQERASGLLNFIEESSYSSVMVFGHWGIFMHLFNEFIRPCEDTFIKTSLKNTSISLLEIDDDGSRSVVFWNDYSHLNALGE